MKAKVYRNGEYITEVEAVRTSPAALEYINGVKSGDVLEVDGGKLKVIYNFNNPGALRDGLSFEVYED